jgi:hypothetical protein
MMEDELVLNRDEFDKVQEQIRIALQEEALSLESLVRVLALPEEKAIRAIRWLMDHGRILRQPDEKLCWNAKQGKHK